MFKTVNIQCNILLCTKLIYFLAIISYWHVTDFHMIGSFSATRGILGPLPSINRHRPLAMKLFTAHSRWPRIAPAVASFNCIRRWRNAFDAFLIRSSRDMFDGLHTIFNVTIHGANETKISRTFEGLSTITIVFLKDQNHVLVIRQKERVYYAE